MRLSQQSKSSKGDGGPLATLAEWWQFNVTDHGALRRLWHNTGRVAEGVYRSNQPTTARLERYAAMGVRSVLNLRGTSKNSFSKIETRTCERLGMTLTGFHIRALVLPTRERLLELHQVFLNMQEPFLIHCKSGADRTGFVAALYLLMIKDRPVAEARQQLHWRYMHFAFTRSGIQDHFLDCFAAAQAKTGVSMIDWLRHDYDSDAVTRSFEAKRGKRTA
jgi:protein tyrosine phosphatase (PTP) superfamily phosphohydrolase (DUF442 family)